MYFNDSEPYVAAWLRNLYPEATVDDRSILAVNPGDLPGHRRCHFFAGIGGWQYALELAGWPDAEPIWTASLPCQPFSAAGRAAGVCDERHLWPAFHRLVAECRPPVIVGEQVASKAGRAWLAGVRVDLEELGYAVGAADLSAASVGAPHIRQRLFWVGDAGCHGGGRASERDDDGPERAAIERAGDDAGGVGDTARRGFGANGRASGHTGHADEPGAGGVADADGRRRGAIGLEEHTGQQGAYRRKPVGHGADGWLHWTGAEWLPCLDGKARRTQPGVRLLVDGVPGRTAQLRALGNAIVPQIAAEFVRAYREARRA